MNMIQCAESLNKNDASTLQLRLNTTYDSLMHRCFECGINDATSFQNFVNYVQGCLGSGGGGSVQDMQVVWTPTNIKLGQLVGIATSQSVSPQLSGITTLTFNQTQMDNGQLELVFNAPNLTSISFPNLLTSGSNKILDAENNPALVSVTFPVATTVGLLNIVNAPSLTTFSAPLMTLGTPNLTGPSSLVTASFPSLITSNNLIDFDTNGSLTTINLPALVNAPGGFFCETNPLLTTVNVPVLVPVNNMGIDFHGCALNAASVNLILRRGVLNAAYTADTIDLAGGTSAAPSGQGIADKATLIGRGVTVNTN